MAYKETAPSRETWMEHLQDVPNEELATLAGDYCWILEKNRPSEERELFRKRRQAILAECERRGMEEAARSCRPSEGIGEG